MHHCIVKIKYFFNRNIFLVFFTNIYGLTMIFNSLHEINISLIGIIHQIIYLMYNVRTWSKSKA